MIFISYSGKEHLEEIDQLVKDLELLDKSVWLDKKLSGGQEWWDTILDNILQSDVFIFIVTEKSLKSIACTSEYTYALALNKPLLPITIDNKTRDKHLPPQLSKFQVLNYQERNSRTALELAKSIYNIYKSHSKLPINLPEPPDIPIPYINLISERIDTTKELSHQEQSVLFFDLKKYIDETSESELGFQLLGKFKNRRDLLAVIDREINNFSKNQKSIPIATKEMLNSPRSKSNTKVKEKIDTISKEDRHSLDDLIIENYEDKKKRKWDEFSSLAKELIFSKVIKFLKIISYILVILVIIAMINRNPTEPEKNYISEDLQLEQLKDISNEELTNDFNESDKNYTE